MFVVEKFHYLVVASDILAQFIITFTYLESWLEHRLVIKMEPDIAMTQFQSSYASNQTAAGAHIEGGLVQEVGNVSNVGGGGEVQGLEVPVDGAKNLGVIVHD